MKPVRLPAAATRALPRWLLLLLCALYILPGLIARDPWKTVDATSFGIMWTMADGGLADWLAPNVAGMPSADKGPLAYWIGALLIRLLGPLLGDVLATRVAALGFFVLSAASVWYATYLLGRRPEAQPLRLAFGGQPTASDYGRTLADGALLIYLGCLGLLAHSHSATADALQVALVAFALYAATRLFETGALRNAALLGIVFGLLVLTRGWVVPLGLWLSVCILAAMRRVELLRLLLAVTLPLALLTFVPWPLAIHLADASSGSALAAWAAWNGNQIGLPSTLSIIHLLKNGIWFAWPAWPFAGWALYAWRNDHAPHIALPASFAATGLVLALLCPAPDEGTLLPLLPALAILAAFGLPTMKRGAINAVDWFSVMTLTTCAALIWLGWIALQTGWPTQLARNAYKAAPGFRAEFYPVAFLVALLATASWFAVVHWRVARRPPVLWRAVVLSSGGVILCWLLLMTLWLPWVNYGKSYAGVARRLAPLLPDAPHCVETNVPIAQRAAFSYFGGVTFARSARMHCAYLLWQDYRRGADPTTRLVHGGAEWELLWEGRRPSDRDERYRLYRRLN